MACRHALPQQSLAEAARWPSLLVKTTTMLIHHDSDESPAQKAWLLVQRYLDECKEAAMEQATMHIQKCLKGHMMAKFAQAAYVTPPPLVSSSSEDEATIFGSLSQHDESSSDEAPSSPVVQHWMREYIFRAASVCGQWGLIVR